MKIYLIIKYILKPFKQSQPVEALVNTDKNANCYLDTEVDGKIESYFPGEKSLK